MIATLEWITPCQVYSLRISVESYRQIERECSRSGSLETGGILVGHYTNDNSTAVVTEVLPPPSDSDLVCRPGYRCYDMRYLRVNQAHAYWPPNASSGAFRK